MAVTNVNEQAKSDFAKKVIEKMPEGSFITCQDKKYYFWSNGIQVCMALTCPKTPVGESSSPPSTFPPVEEKEIKSTTVEYTPEERATIEKLMSALGI